MRDKHSVAPQNNRSFLSETALFSIYQTHTREQMSYIISKLTHTFVTINQSNLAVGNGSVTIHSTQNN